MLKPSDVQRGDVVHHHKGAFRAVVYSVFKDKLDRQWVTYFIEQNCDETYKEHADAFVEQTGPQEILLNSFYHDNKMYVVSMERFLSKFTSEEVTLVMPRIRNIKEMKTVMLIVPDEVKSTKPSPVAVAKRKPKKKAAKK